MISIKIVTFTIVHLGSHLSMRDMDVLIDTSMFCLLQAPKKVEKTAKKVQKQAPKKLQKAAPKGSQRSKGPVKQLKKGAKNITGGAPGLDKWYGEPHFLL